MQDQNHAKQEGRVQGTEDSLRGAPKPLPNFDRYHWLWRSLGLGDPRGRADSQNYPDADEEGQARHQDKLRDESYASKGSSKSDFSCTKCGADAKGPSDGNATAHLRLVEQNAELLERLRVSETKHAYALERLHFYATDSAHILEKLRFSETEHADYLEQLRFYATESANILEELRFSETEHANTPKRLNAQHTAEISILKRHDEGHESRASTPGRADARLLEAAVGRYLGSHGMLEILHAVERTVPWLREYFKEPQIPMAEETVLSVAGHAVREDERAAQLGKDFILFAIVMLPISALSAEVVGIKIHSGFYAYGALLLQLYLLLLRLTLFSFVAFCVLFLSFFLSFFLFSISLSMVRVGQRISDMPPCGAMGILLSAQQVAPALWGFASIPPFLVFNIASPRLISARRKTWVGCLNFLGWLKSRRREQGTVTVAWTCKCGKRLRLVVREEHRQGAVAFAAQAAGPSQQHTIQVTPPPPPSPLTPPGSESDSQGLASSTTRPGTTTTSHSSAPSISSAGDGGSLDHRPVPKGTPRFLLVCVKRGPGLIVPSALNLTDVIHDTTMFQRIREEYYGSKPVESGGWYHTATRLCWDLLRRFFFVPRTVKYVKFQLIRLQKSGTRVGSYETGQIPSVKQVYNMEYSYRPCPLDIGPYPLDPSIFMHWFLDPGDHADDPSMAVERLPKKLHSSLEDDMTRNTGNTAAGGSRPPPIGWGIYIVEGLNWARVQVIVLILLLAISLLSVIWSTTKEDLQGGMGIGQYLIALIVAVLTVSLLGFTQLEDLARGPE